MTMHEYLQLKTKLKDNDWRLDLLYSIPTGYYISVKQTNTSDTCMAVNIFSDGDDFNIEYVIAFDEGEGVRNVAVWMNKESKQAIDTVIENFDFIKDIERRSI